MITRPRVAHKPEDYSFIQQRINYAMVRNGVLYVSIAHPTYAESSPQNAYAAAVDLSSGKLLWKSQSLVSNGRCFDIVDGVLICGYGFTAEPDYIYQLDTATGRVLASTPVKSKADYLIVRDKTLYVRTYNTDYVYFIQ